MKKGFIILSVVFSMFSMMSLAYAGNQPKLKPTRVLFKDSDGDGIPDFRDADANGNGIEDAIEDFLGENYNPETYNPDAGLVDALEQFLDQLDDNLDNIDSLTAKFEDAIENLDPLAPNVTANSDEVADVDVNGDGAIDELDFLVDTDHDGIFDSQDTDDDNDGIPDSQDKDANGNGILDVFEHLNGWILQYLRSHHHNMQHNAIRNFRAG